jgi:site-specific DNA recombinase
LNPLNSELDLVCESLSDPESDSTTGDGCGIDSRCMRKAALYARVSTEGQTIESQVFELKRQIATAGHVLVKEYRDHVSGTLLDRPALEEMRKDAKTDLFDAVYFLDADRISRDVSYQRIIIGELLKYENQIIIKGKDYQQNPENKLALTMLGAFAEFERAKIMERMARGRLHYLRQGKLASNGHCTYGYVYKRKAGAESPRLVVQANQAEVVRLIFEMFAEGKGIGYITRSLEERKISTARGKKMWRPVLKNHTYTGVKYFNSMRRVMMPSTKRGSTGYLKTVHRDRSEWVAVRVPAIISQELFGRVQEKFRERQQVYRQPLRHHLLGELIVCGECGAGYSSYNRYVTKDLRIGKQRVYHKAAYKCNRRTLQTNHTTDALEHCHNKEIATHLLEDKVFELIRDNVLDRRNCESTLRF